MARDRGRLTEQMRRQERLESGADAHRVPCRPPLSPNQRACAALLSAGRSHQEIAERLGCTVKTIRFYIQDASRRIPGNLRASKKLIAWYRGASRKALGADRP